MIESNELTIERKRTTELISEKMEEVRRQAVVLEPETLALLDRLEIADADRELIRAWDGVLMPQGCYRTREAVKILNMATDLADRIIFAATPWGASAARRQGSGERYLPLRMWREFWDDAAPATTLRAAVKRVITALLDERELSLPSVQDAARYLGPTPRVSQIAVVIRESAAYPGASGRLYLNTPKMPEILEMIEESGMEYDRDVRPLDTPENLAADPTWGEREWVVCSHCGLAVERGVAMLHQSTASGKVRIWGNYDNPTAPVTRAHCPICRLSQDMLDSMIAREYTRLEELQFRSIGVWPCNTPNVAEALAWEYDTTVEVVERILAGEKIGRRVRREKCPMAADCPTFCGSLQLGGHPRPLTRDGRWQSCDYALFLKNDTAGALAALSEQREEEEMDKAVEVFDAMQTRGSAQPTLL